MQHKNPVCILIAPLDWGLGHATRCIPIINQLLLQNARVIIAATGTQKLILKQEFPGLTFVEMPGYNINYKRGNLLKWGLLFDIPGILRQIKKENRWLEEIRKIHPIQAVISDNRYGLYNLRLTCVFITHQLYIQSGTPARKQNRGFRCNNWIDRKIMKWNFNFISKFTECWVPDLTGQFSIAGKLSNPAEKLGIPVKYIGILSRFINIDKQVVKNTLLILLSGPEPQRSEFENILIEQLEGISMQTTILRGLPGEGEPVPFVIKGIKIFNHLPAQLLAKLMADSEFIIARSGYSTIMDLIQLKKNAILVPTPGQTEQEYLGFYLHEKRWMYSAPQKNFKLQEVIKAYQKAELILPKIPETNLFGLVTNFLEAVTKRNSSNK